MDRNKKQKCAILLRGHTNRVQESSNNNGGPILFDCSRGSLNSIIRNCIVPLKENYEVDIYVCASDELRKSYIIPKIAEQTKRYYYFESFRVTASSQAENVLYGLNTIKNSEMIYDKILVTRMDLIYKKKITHFLKNKKCEIIYPFKEVGSQSHRVADTIQWINNDSKNRLLQIMIDAWNSCRKCPDGHNLKENTDKKATSCFMTEGVYDSNTSRPPDSWGGINFSKNPIYAMSGRRYYFKDIKHSTLFDPEWKMN